MDDLYEKWKSCGCPICKLAIFSSDLKNRMMSSKKYTIDIDDNDDNKN